MTQSTDQLTKLLNHFVADLMDKLPRIQQTELNRRLTEMENRMTKMEKALQRLGAEGVGPKATGRVKRVTLKQRVIRLVKANPDGIRTSEVARALGVAQTNVSHALRQATEEGEIVKERRGLYRPGGKN